MQNFTRLPHSFLNCIVLCKPTDNQQNAQNTLTNDAMAKHRLTVTDRPIV